MCRQLSSANAAVRVLVPTRHDTISAATLLLYTWYTVAAAVIAAAVYHDTPTIGGIVPWLKKLKLQEYLLPRFAMRQKCSRSFNVDHSETPPVRTKPKENIYEYIYMVVHERAA